MEAHRVVRRRGSHIFYKTGSQMAVRMSVLRTGDSLSPRRFLVLYSVRGSIDSRAIVRLVGLGQLKKPMTSSGLNPRPSSLTHSASTNFATACPQTGRSIETRCREREQYLRLYQRDKSAVAETDTESGYRIKFQRRKY
jgi:hypothetical protein